MTAPSTGPRADEPVPYTLTAKAHAALAAGPVPFTLTAKAHAALAAAPVMHCGCGYDDCTACAGYGWACQRCGLAFFGGRPDDGLCRACQPGDSR